MATVRSSAIAPALAPARADAPGLARLTSLDTLRGVVMVLMALDHVRDFFSSARFDPLDLTRTTPAFFLTRWITHFCAPVFISLAGVSAYLYAARGRHPAQLARYLFTRGLWLVALELTVVHLGWSGSFDPHFLLAQVIWAIGWSLMALGALVALRLPRGAIATLAVALIAGHNLLGGVDRAGAALGAFAPLWTVLHAPGPVRLAPGYELFVLYPLIPWIGVLAGGYALGPLCLRPAAERRRVWLWLGAGFTLAFVVLRLARLYGDPRPWLPRASALLSFFDFVNVEKYPPSLLFLLMTLGPALLALAWLEGATAPGPVARFFIAFGRVPLFFYVLHLLFIRALAGVVLPPGGGYALPGVYLVWLFVVAGLWPVCALFARLKAGRRQWWWSYL